MVRVLVVRVAGGVIVDDAAHGVLLIAADSFTALLRVPLSPVVASASSMARAVSPGRP
jgi:hypothetical protein